jgi:hypothetical protein
VCDLTSEEQKNVRAALRFLRAKIIAVASASLFVKAMRTNRSTIRAKFERRRDLAPIEDMK